MAGEADGPSPKDTAPRAEARAERGPEQVGKAARKLLVEKAAKTFTDSEGKSRTPDMDNPREAALRIVQQVATAEHPNFDFGDEPGPNDIILSSYEDPDGAFTIKNGRMIGIKDADEDGVVCDFLDVDGNKRTLHVSREQMVDNVLGAYRTELADAFDGTEKATIQDHLAYIDAEDPDALMTMDEARTVATSVADGNTEVADKLKALEERTVLSHDEFADVLGGAGKQEVRDATIKASGEWRKLLPQRKAAEEARDKAEAEGKPANEIATLEEKRRQLSVETSEAQERYNVFKKAEEALNANADAAPATPTDDGTDILEPSERTGERTQAERVLQSHKDRIRNQIRDMEDAATDEQGNIDPSLKENDRYKELQYLHALMDNAEHATGDFGPLVQKGALEHVRTVDGVKQLDVEQLLREGSEFDQQVAQAKDKAEKFFEGKTDLPEDKRKQFLEALNNPMALCDLLLNDGDMQKMGSEITEKVYGTLSDADADRLLQNIITSNSHLDEETRTKLQTLAKISKRTGLIAAILLAIPVAAVALAAAGAAVVAGEAGKRAAA